MQIGLNLVETYSLNGKRISISNGEGATATPRHRKGCFHIILRYNIIYYSLGDNPLAHSAALPRLGLTLDVAGSR